MAKREQHDQFTIFFAGRHEGKLANFLQFQCTSRVALKKIRPLIRVSIKYTNMALAS